MTVTAVRLADMELTAGIDGKWRASARWLIDTDDETQGYLSILTEAQAAGMTPHVLPQVGTSWSFDGDSVAGLYLNAIRLRRQTEPRKKSRLEATGEYQTPTSGGTGPLNPNPLQRAPIGWLEFATETEIVHTANIMQAMPQLNLTVGQETPIVTAAGVDYDTPIFEDAYQAILVQQANFGDLDDIYGIARTYDRTVNSAPFYNFPKHHAQFRGIFTGPPQVVSGVQFWSATTRVALGRKPFYRDIVNRGFDALGLDGKKYQIRRPIVADDPESKKTLVTAPQLLKPDGRELPVGPTQIGNTIPYLTRDEVPYDGLVWIPADPIPPPPA